MIGRTTRWSCAPARTAASGAACCRWCRDKNRVVVEGVNLIKRHTRPNPQKNIKGGIVEREAAIHASNVMLLDPETNEPTRIGSKKLRGRHARAYRPQERRSGGQMSKKNQPTPRSKRPRPRKAAKAAKARRQSTPRAAARKSSRR